MQRFGKELLRTNYLSILNNYERQFLDNPAEPVTESMTKGGQILPASINAREIVICCHTRQRSQEYQI